MKARTDLSRRFRIGPAVLLLGEGYGRLESGHDPLLSMLQSKYGTTAADYSAMLDPNIQNQHSAFLQWFAERSSTLPVPAWLRTVASFPWSTLYTTAVDGMWVQAFRHDWRELRILYDDLQRPEQPRSKTELTCALLFGSAAWHELAPVPESSFALRRRAAVAARLLARLPEIVTPRGIVAIEGYDVDDWLSPSQLLPLLADLGEDQVHIFSVSEALAANPDIEHLVAQGVVVLHRESLASVLSAGAESGRLLLGSPITGRETGHRIELEDRVLDVPLELWRRVTRSAVLLEDDVLADPPALSRGAQYHEFRQFLERSEGKPDWRGFARGFAFERDVQAQLTTAVEDALGARSLPERPIIVHGSTGTGKTVTLAKLAYTIRRARKYPVLYLPRRTHSPNFADLESFVQWAETNGAPAVLIIWDAMTGIDDYQDLARFFASRGRKGLVVGSLYRSDFLDSKRSIEIPRSLTAAEAARFRSHLARIDERLAAAAPSDPFVTENDFLVSLYRLLPPSRMQLRAGVAREVGFAETLIVAKERDRGTTVTPRTAMQLALAEAGLLEDLPPLLSEPAHLGGEDVLNIQRLTGLVMVPGQFNLGVPIELLLRTLGRESYGDFISLMEGTDVFEWYEDPGGNIEIGPRTGLEAQIIVQTRLGGPATEVAVVCELIRNMVAGAPGGPAGREVEFASKLAQALDTPGGPHDYRAHFSDVADALRDARSQRGVHSPQLMLQEAHLRREWARRDDPAGASLDARLDALASARDVLDVALDSTEAHQRHIRGNLYTELASAFAMTAVMIMRSSADVDAAQSAYVEAIGATEDARRAMPDTYYPLDVLAWATFDLIEHGLLRGDTQVEALAEVAVALETADTHSLSDKSLDQLRRRQLQLASAFSDAELSDRAFDDLLARNSSAGVVFRALEKAGGPRRDNWGQADAETAFRYCAEYRDRFGAGADQRLRELMLDLWWRGRTGEDLLARERVALDFSEDDWTALRSLCSDALGTGESRRSLRLQFLRSICEFHLGEISLAFDTLAGVEREANFSRSRWNVIRAYVASDSAGKPRRYDGIVADPFDGGMHAEIFVERLQRRLPIRARDFGGSPLERGQTISGFHIAFSYQGAIADPPSAFTVARDRERGSVPRRSGERGRR